MKNILLVGNTSWSFYNFRRNLISELLNNGYQVTILAPFDDFYTKKLLELGCNFNDFNYNTKNINLLYNVKILIKLVLIYRKIKPNFIFHYTIKPNILGSLASNILKIPNISVVTGLGHIFIKKSFLSFFLKWIYVLVFFRTEEVWCLNNEDKDFFTSNFFLKKSKFKLLNGEGIDLNFFAPDKKMNEEVSFILICRLIWEKGVLEYVEAAKIIKNNYPHINFKILGFLDVDNPSAVPEKYIKNARNNSYVTFLGNTDNVIPYIIDSTCVVLPSFYKEGLSRVLLEASALERPIITTNISGCKEVVDENITGLLCEPRDIKSLVIQIEKMINLTYYQRLTMGIKGRIRMFNLFSSSKINSSYINYLSCFFKN